jgi:hypothetical protein
MQQPPFDNSRNIGKVIDPKDLPEMNICFEIEWSQPEHQRNRELYSKGKKVDKIQLMTE